jgi:hypothetical protein
MDETGGAKKATESCLIIPFDMASDCDTKRWNDIEQIT